MPGCDVVNHLHECLEEGRKDLVLGQWVNHVRKIDLTESYLNVSVMLTDFSATLDLRARQTDDCSVNNDAVLDMFYVMNNFIEVSMNNNEKTHLYDTTFLRSLAVASALGRRTIMFPCSLLRLHI